MNWEVIVTSGITSAVVGAAAGGIVSYWVGRGLQRKEHEFQRQRERRAEAKAEEARWDAIRLNSTQKEILQFCLANPSERYSLQSGSGTYWLAAGDTKERVEIPDMTIGNQLDDMEIKGYIKTLLDQGPWRVFELTGEGGPDGPIEQARS